MSESTPQHVPRSPEEPTPDDVLAVMTVCEPYTVGGLTNEFSDASRWTIQRRLDELVERGDIQKKKHSENRVSYWMPADGDN